MVESASALRLGVEKTESDTLVVDCGIEVPGGLEAGRMLAECCMADLARVLYMPGRAEFGGGPLVQVTTDHPVAACMASQYAGWEVKGDDFFAMGSGPMRAAANQEALFADIGFAEQPPVAVGILESRQTPPAAVIEQIAKACDVPTDSLLLLVAPTASQAGTVQVVARSVETTMHKLHEVGYDLSRVESGYGTAPLPPVAKNDLAAIGRTNDAILYGGEVTLWVRDEDQRLAEIGPKIPSSSSADHGRPFAEIFAAYDHDFYKIDKMLFSPAVVRLVNLNSGRTFSFGEVRADVVRQSFES